MSGTAAKTCRDANIIYEDEHAFLIDFDWTGTAGL